MEKSNEKSIYQAVYKTVLLFIILVLTIFFLVIKKYLEMQIDMGTNNLILYIDEMKDKSNTFSNLIAEDPQIIKGTIKAKTSIVKEALLKYSALTNITFGTIHDLEGYSLSKLHNIKEFFKDDNKENYVNSILNSKKETVTGFTKTKEGLVLMSSVPIYSKYDSKQFIGFVSSGYMIDDNFAKRIQNNSGVEVIFMENADIIGKTFGQKKDLLNKISLGLDFGKIKYLIYNHKIYGFKSFVMTKDLVMIGVLNVTKQVIVIILSVLFFLIFIIVGVIIGTYQIKIRNVSEKRKLAQVLLDDTIMALTSAIDAKDPYTKGHSYRVSEISVRIGKAIGIKEEELDRLKYSALLHDIGKIGIDDRIIRKNGKLTDEEFAQMQEHPVIGGQILNKGSLKEFSEGAIYHHEKFNGSGQGFDNRLSGERIPLFARIISIADVYDALMSNRPYRKSLGKEVSLSIINKDSGTHFDPELVNKFNSIVDDLHDLDFTD